MSGKVEAKPTIEYTVLSTGERLSKHPEITCDSYKEAQEFVEGMKEAEKNFDLPQKIYRIYAREVRYGKWDLMKKV